MQKTKLIALLKTFSRQEMKDFEKFISSPYFSSGRNLKPLFKILKKYYPDFDSPNLTVEKIFCKIYPGKKFERKKSLHTLQVLMSEIIILAEKFMVIEGFKLGKFSYQYNKSLAEQYHDKRLFESSLKAAIKNSEIINKKINVENFYHHKVENNLEISSKFIYLNKPEKMFEYSKENLLYIYADFFAGLTKYVHLLFVMKKRYNFSYPGFELIKKFISSFESEVLVAQCTNDNFDTKNILILNYYLLKSRLDENDKDCLIKVFEIYVKVFNNLSRATQYNIYELLFSRLYGRIRFDVFYLNKANELIDFAWGRNIITPNDNLRTILSTYNSALTVKAALSKKEDLMQFIDKYCITVEVRYIEDIRNYSHAFLYFKEKSFDNCLRAISRQDSLNSVSFKINKYKLKICCFFEQFFLDNLLSSIDSFEHYLRNNKNVSEINKIENLKFIICMKKIIKMKLGKVQESDPEINDIITLTQNSIFGYWFKEKLEELTCKNPN